MNKLSIWTHPKTNEERVYLNGIPYADGAKVFLTKDEVTGLGTMFKVNIIGYVRDRAAIERSVDFHLEELTGSKNVNMWAQIELLTK